MISVTNHFIGQHTADHAETVDIARKTLDIIPFIMRVMSAEMRSTQLEMLDSQLSSMGALRIRPYILSDLATMMQVSSPTMSNTVSTLESRGWVTRRRDTVDRRVVWIEITQAGLDVLESFEAQVAERLAGFLAGLSHDQKATLTDGLSVLFDAFSQGMNSDPALR
jgi:DNA-binding MarR family transcriptional regulator